MIDRFISDHATVLCLLDSVKPCTAVKEISYRQLKSIDMDALRADLMTSEWCTNVFTDLDMMITCYNSTPLWLLDKYAPLRTKSVATRKRVPWINHRTSLIFLNCRKGLGLSSLWSIWLPTIYILSFNRRINSNTARRRPYFKLRMIFWCLWMSNMSPYLYY